MELDVLTLRHDRHEPQPEELPVTDLTEFASLPLPELTAELERMLANHHAPRRAYAERTTSTPATAGPSRDAAGDFIPLDRAMAGTFSTATRSGQVTPSPADTAARGDLIGRGVSA